MLETVPIARATLVFPTMPMNSNDGDVEDSRGVVGDSRSRGSEAVTKQFSEVQSESCG